MNHPTIAEELAAALSAETPIATEAGRQGDVVLIRTGEPALAPHTPAPHGGILLVAGKHGEHRLIGRAVKWLCPGVVSVEQTADVVHTDVPTDRHGPFRLAAGTWTYHRSQELTADNVVRKVED